MLRATVHEASIADRDGIKLLLPTDITAEQQTIDEQFPRLAHLWLDGGYHGAGKGQDWVEQTLGWTVDLVKHPPKPRVCVLSSV